MIRKMTSIKYFPCQCFDITYILNFELLYFTYNFKTQFQIKCIFNFVKSLKL